MISPSFVNEATIVEIIDFIAGKAVKLRNGLNNLNVLITEIFAILGVIESKLVNTTMKSSQFQESLKYVFLSNTKPKAMIFITASEVKATIKKGSA